MKKFLLQDIPVNAVTSQNLIKTIFSQKTLHCTTPLSIQYVNAHSYVTVKKNKQLKKALRTANIVYPDGWGVVLLGKLWNAPIKTRLTAYDFFPQFLKKATSQKTSLYFLGSTEKRIKKAMTIIKRQYPSIRIQGYHHGYMQTKKENNAIIQDINKKHVDILLVGMGTPLQELWTYNYKHRLHVTSIWCVGGLFDYLSGDIKHCPPWIGDRGFQWLWRLTHEPKRLWKRYLLELPQFFIYSIQAKLKKA